MYVLGSNTQYSNASNMTPICEVDLIQ